jgi:hypothetical protein
MGWRPHTERRCLRGSTPFRPSRRWRIAARPGRRRSGQQRRPVSGQGTIAGRPGGPGSHPALQTNLPALDRWPGRPPPSPPATSDQRPAQRIGRQVIGIDIDVRQELRHDHDGRATGFARSRLCCLGGAVVDIRIAQPAMQHQYGTANARQRHRPVAGDIQRQARLRADRQSATAFTGRRLGAASSTAQAWRISSANIIKAIRPAALIPPMIRQRMGCAAPALDLRKPPDSAAAMVGDGCAESP